MQAPWAHSNTEIEDKANDALWIPDILQSRDEQSNMTMCTGNWKALAEE